MNTPPTDIYTLSLHDALPIYQRDSVGHRAAFPDRLSADRARRPGPQYRRAAPAIDRKSTRLNSSHVRISYAVFCLKKKKIHIHITIRDIGMWSTLCTCCVCGD